MVKNLFSAALLAVFMVGAGPASAQNSRAVNSARIEVLERQVKMLRSRLGEAPQVSGEAPAVAANPALLADLSAKIGTLESQIRRLNGRLEEFEYRQRQMQEEMDLLRKGMEMQRQELLRATPGLSPAQPQGGVAIGQPGAAPGGAGEVAVDGGEALGAVADEPLSITLPEGDAASQYSYAFAFVQKNDLARGRLALEEFINANAGDSLVGNAKYWLGRIHLQEGRNAAAAQQLLALIEEHPNHKKRVDALVDLADVLLKLDAAGDACDALAEFARVEDKASARLKTRAERVRQNARCDS